MTYDLAVWEGERPADDVAASEAFEALYKTYIDSDETHPPSARIHSYVSALLARYPDMDDDNDDVCPWSSAPLLDEATGPIVYFPMRWSMADDVSAWAAQLAADHGLICFDPQQNALRP
ncbi:hypothetical protein DFJ67_0286 [Asanoa ferruginea]|uniref:Uncharacterized protein n=1 Tax=Asanoa ferruginea TaxID=53367 RepID=A0A3D9ZAS3_9ACTN|nr:hypothetical protein [Asanoa ferruginea]REF94367.1 hypothetical protein DFJ67_0286 [Asanoa ferruginea]GIF51117.1 hypothetical protein Afe04nite_56560 [Asanoa ferruginea]